MVDLASLSQVNSHPNHQSSINSEQQRRSMADMVEHADAPPDKTESGAGDAEIEITTNWDETTTTFDAMDLKEDLLRGIYAYGFEKPSAIQQRAVKPILIGRDVIAQAQSGEKTPS